MHRGYIKLWRKLTESNMYKNLNSKQRDILIQCLLMANHQENEWTWGKEIYKCVPGQFITSLDSLKDKCSKDVSVQSVRTSLLKLEQWHFLTNKSTKTGRLITICKWDTYQNVLTTTNKEPTKSQQRANKELTANKNDNNVKNEKKSCLKPEWLELVELLKSLILQNNPEANISKTYKIKWYDSVRLMIKYDKRTIEKIKTLITWSQKDTFWKTNILSMSKLRQQFDKLTLRERNEKPETKDTDDFDLIKAEAELRQTIKEQENEK